MVTRKISSTITVASGSVIVALVLLLTSSVAFGQADHVRWDIISVDVPPPLTVLNPDGDAFAFAYHTPGNPSEAKIRLTGAGTFVAPASGGPSGAVTGGGTWETSGSGLPEGSGTYRVTKLVSWVFAGFQTGTPTDNIGDVADIVSRSAGLKPGEHPADQLCHAIGAAAFRQARPRRFPGPAAGHGA